MRARVLLVLAVVSIFCFKIPLYAGISIGFGANYDFDWSLNMPNGENQLSVPVDTVQLSYQNTNYSMTNQQVPLMISRSAWEREPFNFGLRMTVAGIPFIDMIELSTSLNVWQYKGYILYPDSLAQGVTIGQALMNPSLSSNYQYATQSLFLKDFGLNYLGLQYTPYAVLGVDLNIRKQIISRNIALLNFRGFAGGGVSVDFATPALSVSLVDKLARENLPSTVNVTSLQSPFSQTALARSVTKAIINGFMTPNFGMNILTGASVRISPLPLELYVDGKLHIPFTSIDNSVSLNGFGVSVATGLAVWIGG